MTYVWRDQVQVKFEDQDQSSRSDDEKMFSFGHGCCRLIENWKWRWENRLQRIVRNAGGNDTVPISM